MPQDSHHGSFLIADRHGVLIRGVSGAGKTALALEILNHCAAMGRFARLVCDDQVLLSAHGERLIGRAPPAIGGLAEARLYGPAPLTHEPAAVVDLVIDLVGNENPARFQQDGVSTLNGVKLSHILLSGSDLAGAVRAISARLGLPPFNCTHLALRKID